METPQVCETIVLGTSHFQEANESVRAALDRCNSVLLDEVCAQRYLGCAMPEGKHLEIHGTPGNDLGCYMDGGTIEVFGSGQDQVGNTMNAGSIVIHGRCGDAAGYGMRGGSIFIKDDCGWRVGINMKQYEDKCPAIVIGGNAGSFLGEYMAGGIIVLFGEPGEYLATGMHGGVIYLRQQLDNAAVPDGLVLDKVTSEDESVLSRLLDEFKENFPDSPNVSPMDFYKLHPMSSRPYASMYA